MSSVPAFIEPVVELTSLSREAGALVLIDGAHAIGQVEVRLLSGCAKSRLWGDIQPWLITSIYDR